MDSEYNKYVLEKFEVALSEVCIRKVAENYNFEEHTEELNFCIEALIAMGED